MKLSLLDRSRTRAGRPDAEGLTGSVERARWAEQFGYERFWVAEHHTVPGIASGSPPVLLAAIGAVTSRIRLGSGGVMLPNHQPLVVAEQFRMLAALYPGRIDLGIGRSLGFTPPVRRALRHDDSDTYDEDLRELLALLDGTGPVTVRPVVGRPATEPIPVSLLATGGGVGVAARFGLPVVVGGPALWSNELADALAAYRRDFQPSVHADRPRVTVSVDVLLAEDEAHARELALPEAWAMARSRQTGEFWPLESVEAISSQPWPDQVRRRVESTMSSAIAGTPQQVRSRLDDLVARTDAAELLASSSTYDREALAASDRLLRDLIA